MSDSSSSKGRGGAALARPGRDRAAASGLRARVLCALRRGASHPRAAGRTLTVVVALLAAAACATHRPSVIGPVADAQSSARALQERTSLEEPLRILFHWQLNEAGGRLGGRGVARVEPPYKARLDLFLDNGETVMSAALVDGELRLPVGARRDILPPPDLMWGALGVFRPQARASLLGGDELEAGGLLLRYASPNADTQLHYEAQAGELQRIEMLDDGHVVQRVELSMGEAGRYPLEATYRDLTVFRELRLTRESLEVVAPFPADIWDPRG